MARSVLILADRENPISADAAPAIVGSSEVSVESGPPEWLFAGMPSGALSLLTHLGWRLFRKEAARRRFVM
jgi:hypothetical protein